MFTKQLCRPLLWLHAHKHVPEILWQSCSNNASSRLLKDILANSGPESMLPAAMHQGFRDMDPEMQEIFKKVVQCEYKVQRMEKLYMNAEKLTEAMWTQLYHARTLSERNLLMQKFCDEQEAEYYMKHKRKGRAEFNKNISQIVIKRESVDSKVGNTNEIPKVNDTATCVYRSFTNEKRFYTQRQLNSQTFGLDLVIDLKDVHQMKKKQQKDVLKSVHSALIMNSKARDPFRIVLCNSELKQLSLQGPGHDFSNFLVDITEKSYLDLFPRKKLVYLSANAKPEHVQFNPQFTYIIGGLPSIEHRDISLARAKKDNVRVQELPLRHHLSHINGRLSIPVSEVLLIMLALKGNDGNYCEAFRSIFRKPNFRNEISGVLKGFTKSQREKGITGEENYIDNLLHGHLSRSRSHTINKSSNNRRFGR